MHGKTQATERDCVCVYVSQCKRLVRHPDTSFVSFTHNVCITQNPTSLTTTEKTKTTQPVHWLYNYMATRIACRNWKYTAYGVRDPR